MEKVYDLITFKDKVNEISLLLVMTAEGDDIGVSMLCDMCEALKPFNSLGGLAEKIIQDWQVVEGKRASLSKADFYKVLAEFINSAARSCEACESNSLATKLSDQPNASVSYLDQVDPSFLPDFIESHKMQLEDLEAWLLNSEFKNEEGEDVEALTKRYVHSLKGDAGSIGLVDVEKTCHFVEDYMAKSSVKVLAPELLQFKEWILAYIAALTNKTTPAELGSEFRDKFKRAVEAKQVPHDKPNQAGTTEIRKSEVKASAAPKAIISNQPSSSTDEKYELTGETDIFQEFIAEAEEHLGQVESVMLESEGNYSKDAVDRVFRGIHSLKGGSAYFNFKEMTETSHILESLLDEVRVGKREFNQDLTALVLSYIDLQKNLFTSAKAAFSKDRIISRCPASVLFLQALDEFVSGKLISSANQVSERTENASADMNVANEENKGSAMTNTSNQSSVAAVSREKEAAEQKGEKLDVKNFVKVDTVRLDHLIDSIGEMVIYSSMLIRRCRELLPMHEDVLSVTHRVEKFTRDLQDVGMSMRLVPIKSLFQKMSRLVWDTSKKIKKEIAFSMDGEDTELDRNLIDKLADPLMHMVRNALDHGVEPPDEREKIGKSRAGKVHLSASHSGGSILIKIEDDGRGLNTDKLLAKAKEKGIVGESDRLSEQEIYQLIFAPGFSTAAVVTDISGRGVGMDVVRRNVESLRGRINIESKVGVGTKFTIELPLTLAIVDGVEVLVGAEHFIIPSLAIVEFIKPGDGSLNSAFDRGETFFFRGNYLPILRIAELYDVKPKYTDPMEATFVVVENHEELVALMVDEIVGELSTVIKSLGMIFSEVKGVSGCAVMPNGDAALILDIRSLVRLARTDNLKPKSPAAEVNQTASAS